MTNPSEIQTVKFIRKGKNIYLGKPDKSHGNLAQQNLDPKKIKWHSDIYTGSIPTVDDCGEIQIDYSTKRVSFVIRGSCQSCHVSDILAARKFARIKTVLELQKIYPGHKIDYIF